MTQDLIRIGSLLRYTYHNTYSNSANSNSKIRADNLAIVYDLKQSKNGEMFISLFWLIKGVHHWSSFTKNIDVSCFVFSKTFINWYEVVVF